MKHPGKKHEHYYAETPTSKPRLGIVRTRMRGHFFEFLTSPSVFSKTRVDLGSRLLIESMILPDTGNILDIGCGYGPVGIAAAVLNPALRVVMTDVNDRAIWLAKKNAKLNGANNTDVRQGFLYSPVEDMTFHTILANPPVSAGLRVTLPLVAGARKHLIKDGLLQLVVKSKIGGKRLLGVLQETFGKAEVLSRKSGYRVFLSKNS